MRKPSELEVSGKNVFPRIEEMLAAGKRVRFPVSGKSMHPLLIHNRDSVLLAPCSGERLKKGDIILFCSGEEHYMLHRITKVKRGGYITTGDGNLYRDDFVPETAVRAKAELLYRKNRVIDCRRWYWKLVFRLWMAAFWLRRHL